MVPLPIATRGPGNTDARTIRKEYDDSLSTNMPGVQRSLRRGGIQCISRTGEIPSQVTKGEWLLRVNGYESMAGKISGGEEAAGKRTRCSGMVREQVGKN